VAGVVVGVSRTGQTGPAVRWASAEAAVHGLPLMLLHAWPAHLDLSVELAGEALPGLLGPATACAVHGRAAAVLLAQRPELLVLGGHTGARHVSHLTRACLRHAMCPVVVVPDTERPPTRRVVVGVCGTGASHVALRWAAVEARLRAADLVVVHAWQLHPAAMKDVLRPGRVIPAQQPAALERLRGWVDTVLGTAEVKLHALHGGPLDRLLEVSDEADLIVLGRSTHPGIGRVLHGAVSDDLSGLAPCPVAVIPDVPTDHRAGLTHHQQQYQ
jgi:nucleotide-binding universal stress UspA family protein